MDKSTLNLVKSADEETFCAENANDKCNSNEFISLKWRNFKNKPTKFLKSESSKRDKIIQEMCSTIINNDSSLRITSVEATNLFSSLLNKEQLLEKIKKIEIEREPYRLEHNIKFKKYFEIVAHNGIIERICYDNGTKFAFTGGADGVIKCWSIVNGMLVKSLYGHTNMISDLCISRNGEYMVSVDYQGLMNIWSLKTLKIIHSIQFSSEAIFCEFIYPPNTSKTSLGNIFIIFSDGMVKLVDFDLESITAKLANSFMFGESIKAICITDGGRFVICGGWWPFFLIYDTCDLNKIVVAENFRIQTICAAKNALKFAASSENRIHIYTFFCESNSSVATFNKKKTETGFWKRTVNEIDKEYFVEWICFLPSFLLVAACTDNVIRIYEDDSLIFSFAGESGTIYAHPSRNIFAIIGTSLTIYQLSKKKIFSEFDSFNLFETQTRHSSLSNSRSDFKVTNSKLNSFQIEKIFSESIYVNLNDCQFSDDGRFFITCDDQGIIKTYSIEEPINVPEQQFFLKDIDIEITEENFNETYNIYRQKNNDWVKMEYTTTQATVDSRCIEIENQAAKILEKDKLNEERFKALYLSGDVQETQKLNDDFNRSSFSLMTGSDRDDTYIISEDSEKSVLLRNYSPKYNGRSSSNSSDKTTRSKKKNKRMKKLREFKNIKTSEYRRIIDSDDESEEKPSSKKKRKLVISESDDSPLVVQRPSSRNTNHLPEKIHRSSHTLRKNLLFDSEEESDHNPSTHRILRRNLKQSSNTHSLFDSSFLSSNDWAISSEVGRPRRAASVSNQLKVQNNRKYPSPKQSISESNSNSIDSSSRSSPIRLSRSFSNSKKSSPKSNSKKQVDLKNKDGVRSSHPLDSHDYHSGSNCVNSNDSSGGRVLRKHLKSSEDLLSKSYEESPKRFLRKDLPVNSVFPEAHHSLSGIDEDFEERLCKFANTWIASNSIYPNTRVYFNKTNYEEFMKIDPRINYSRKYPKISGFYDVTAVHLDYIGKIPYLTIALGTSHIIKFYEYPDSNGILCTADQYLVKVGDHISLFKKTHLVQDQIILETDEMTVHIEDDIILKSLILPKYKPLNLDEIPYSKNLKPLFISFLSSKFYLQTITNFDLINKKLAYQLYEKPDDFLFDLKMTVDAASELSSTAQEEAEDILETYENIIDQE